MNFRIKLAIVAAVTAAATIGVLEAKKRAGRAAAVRAPWEPFGTYESRVWRSSPPLPADAEPPLGAEPNGWVRLVFDRQQAFVARWEDRRGGRVRTGAFGGRSERRTSGGPGALRLVTTIDGEGRATSGIEPVDIVGDDDGSLTAPGIDLQTGGWLVGSSTTYRKLP